MALYDWNGNGDSNDIADDFIEYQIYKDCTSDEDENVEPTCSSNSYYTSNRTRSERLRLYGFTFIGIIIMGILAQFIGLFAGLFFYIYMKIIVDIFG